MPSVDDGSVELSVRVRKIASVLVIDARGEIDMSTAGELQPAIEAALRAEEPVVVDLCAVSFLDSTGLYALLVLRRRLLEQSRRVAIACWPSGAVAMTLAVSGTDQVFNVYESRAAAIASAR
jgi:anti-anti-sigma factor